MVNQTPDFLDEAVARALRSGDFETVQQLSVELGAAIRLAMTAANLANRVAVFERWNERIQDHLSLARVLRAHISSQLQANTAACLYQPDPGDDHCWRFDA
jgi:hypothetical protein